MTAEQDRVRDLLRIFAVGYNETVRHLGVAMDLPGSDAAGLTEIAGAMASGSLMTPARLARHVGLTSGATNALINRLERRGLVERSRESADRRVVTLRPTAVAAARAGAFAASAGGELEVLMNRLEPAKATIIADFLAQLTSTVEDVNRRLRAAHRQPTSDSH